MSHIIGEIQSDLADDVNVIWIVLIRLDRSRSCNPIDSKLVAPCQASRKFCSNIKILMINCSENGNTND